jgi:serine/threonine protein kinase
MENVDYIFCDVFEPYKMREVYEQKNKLILDSFVLSLRMCIGAIELLIENGIHHNDVHDGNMGFTKEGSFKLIDFGFAKEVDHGLKTPVFTTYYAAPEILKNRSLKLNEIKSYDKSCDIWSLGVIMY